MVGGVHEWGVEVPKTGAPVWKSAVCLPLLRAYGRLWIRRVELWPRIELALESEDVGPDRSRHELIPFSLGWFFPAVCEHARGELIGKKEVAEGKIPLNCTRFRLRAIMRVVAFTYNTDQPFRRIMWTNYLGLWQKGCPITREVLSLLHEQIGKKWLPLNGKRSKLRAIMMGITGTWYCRSATFRRIVNAFKSFSAFTIQIVSLVQYP
jgi:hypothetical protein